MSRSSCSGQNIWDFNQADTTEQGASLISEAAWKSVWVCVCGGGGACYLAKSVIFHS